MRIGLKTWAIFAICLSTALIGSAAWAQAKAPLRFGMAMPLTGSQSGYGVDFVEAARWAVEDINAKGGVAGHPLEMVTLDTQAEPQLGISAVNRLIHVDKVPVFVVAWSAVVRAVAATANREKVLEISVASNAPEIAKLGDYVYTSFPLADVDITALANYTYEKLGKRRAAVMYINNDTGVEAAAVYKRVFEKAGGQVVAFEAYDPKATDFSGAVLKVKAANPDIIHVQGLIIDIPLVIAQIRQLGMTTRVSSYTGAYNQKVIDQLGQGAEGLLVTALAPGVKDNPNVAPFLERWKKTKNRPPASLPMTQYMYDSVYLVADLYKWVLSNGLQPTGENLRKALVTIKRFNYPMTGALEIGDDHRVQKPVYLLTVEKGQFVPVTTIK